MLILSFVKPPLPWWVLVLLMVGVVASLIVDRIRNR
jgi:hypothetical protein